MYGLVYAYVGLGPSLDCTCTRCCWTGLQECTMLQFGRAHGLLADSLPSLCCLWLCLLLLQVVIGCLQVAGLIGFIKPGHH